MISGNQKPKQGKFEVEEKKPYQAPRVLASYDKEEMEAAMQQEGVAAGVCSGCG